MIGDASKITLAEGYIEDIWRTVYRRGVKFPDRRFGPLGKHADCWKNAWEYVEEHDDHEYVEGILCTPTLVQAKSKFDPYPTYRVRPAIWYPHAWAVKRGEEPIAVECTEGYERCEPTYIGIPLDRDSTRILGEIIKTGLPSASVLELTYFTRAMQAAK